MPCVRILIGLGLFPGPPIVHRISLNHLNIDLCFGSTQSCTTADSLTITIQILTKNKISITFYFFLYCNSSQAEIGILLPLTGENRPTTARQKNRKNSRCNFKSNYNNKKYKLSSFFVTLQHETVSYERQRTYRMQKGELFIYLLISSRLAYRLPLGQKGECEPCLVDLLAGEDEEKLPPRDANL